MSILAWWTIPIGSLLLGMAYAAIAWRPRGPRAPTETVQAYEKFRTTMAATSAKPVSPVAATVPPARRPGHHRRHLSRSH